jgi:glycerol uptake facilitator-like aquaporin
LCIRSTTISLDHRFTHSATMAAPNASFAGRLGGIQQFTVNREDPDEQHLLEQTPDAAPNVAVRDLFRMSLFKDPFLWKAACIEAMGSFLLVFVTGYFAISPNVPNPDPSPTSGNFAHAGFIAPLVGLLINGVFITMLIYACGPTSGAHFNPLITIATFFARLTTFPRAVLYVAGQVGGGSLAGLMLRAAVNTREFKVGGCFLFPNDRINSSTALTVEFGAATLLLFLAFGVGLDPRQAELFGPALGRCFDGMILSTVLTADRATAGRHSVCHSHLCVQFHRVCLRGRQSESSAMLWRLCRKPLPRLVVGNMGWPTAGVRISRHCLLSHPSRSPTEVEEVETCAPRCRGQRTPPH